MREMKVNDTPLKVIRRELIRIVLERIQAIPAEMAVTEQGESKELFTEGDYEVEELLNNPYMNRGEIPLAMDIFKPVVPDKKELPVIVMIHGGGLVTGDRTMSRRCSKYLAKKGYLVFSIEYRLAPRASIAEQLDDVCAGMDLIGEKLVDFDVDFTRVFLMAESAGAFLATYVAAMRGSKKLQNAIGYKPTRMNFKALGLICGMFYTNKQDPIGCFLKDQFYGDKRDDKEFCDLMDPENPEILNNIPPAFLVTSRGDFLNRYSLDYHKALKKAGKKSHLVYYGEEDLMHVFPVSDPYREQSQDALKRMLDFFEEQADKARKNKKSEKVTKKEAEKKEK